MYRLTVRGDTPNPSFSSSSAAILFAPRPIRQGHLHDQALHTDWHRRSPAPSRLPAPEQSKAFAVPSNQCRRLDDGENPTPIDQPRKDDQRDPRRIVRTTALHLALD